MIFKRTVFIFVIFLAASVCTKRLKTKHADRKGRKNNDTHRNQRAVDSLEAMVAEQNRQIVSLRADYFAMKQDLQDAKNSLDAALTQLNALSNTVRTNFGTLPGSTFVRWGRSDCPASTQTLYSGVMGGAYAHHTGAGANRVCMTLQPAVKNITVEETGEIDGIEYYLPGHDNQDAVCALCRTPYSTSWMIPGADSCPEGAVKQYGGYLSSGYTGDEAASEFLCLDSDPQNRAGGEGNQNSGYIEHVLAHCGALPCPPYVDGVVVQCVVCSM